MTAYIRVIVATLRLSFALTTVFSGTFRLKIRGLFRVLFFIFLVALYSHG